MALLPKLASPVWRALSGGNAAASGTRMAAARLRTCCRRTLASAAALPQQLEHVEAQLASLPDAEQAAAHYAGLRCRAALPLQQRAAEVFAGLPDPLFGLVANRQLAAIHGNLGDYSSEAKLREQIVQTAAAVSPEAVAAALHEQSVSALRAGDLPTAVAAAGSDAARLGGPMALGWHGTVRAADGTDGEADLQSATSSEHGVEDAGLLLQLGICSAGQGFALDTFERAVAAGEADGAGIGSKLAGVAAAVKIAEDMHRQVEAEASALLASGEKNPAAHKAMSARLDEAEAGLNAAVGAIKAELGDDCPWVGAAVRRVAALYHTRGDSTMAEGLYGGAVGRLGALPATDVPVGLMAEHVLTLEAFAELARQLTWNGQSRVQEAKLMDQTAAELRALLPPAPAALCLAHPEGHALHLLADPMDWLALGWRVDHWSAAVAWGEFSR